MIIKLTGPHPLLLTIPLCLTCCQSTSSFRVNALLADQRVNTTVDSELARYYIEDYLNGRGHSAAYDAIIEAALGESNVEPSDREGLRQLARRFSTDFAAIHFAARLFDIPANRRFQKAFHVHIARLAASRASPAVSGREPHSPYLFAFVPGYAYRKNPKNGADFARQRKVMTENGFRTMLIETEEFGTVERNASIIADVLLRMRESGERIILVSSSKGGPEAAMALGELLPAPLVGHVRAWVSVGGLLRGTPYADQWMDRPRFWIGRLALTLRGSNPDLIRNLSSAVRGDAFARLNIPSSVLMIQYVAVPLSGQIGDDARNRYSRLRNHGPNDGFALLADELVPGGIAITGFGLDHHFRDPSIDIKTIAMTKAVIEELNRLEIKD